jgi:hypothetical protein
MDYSLFKGNKETEKEKYTNINEKITIVAFIVLLILLSLFFALSFYYRENEPISIQISENKEIISFLNKNNGTNVKKTSSNFGWKWYKTIIELAEEGKNWYDSIVPSDYSSTQIANLYKNFTNNLFDIQNYENLIDYLGLNVNITRKIVGNGILIVSYIFDTGIIEMKFDTKFSLKFKGVNLVKLSKKNMYFIILSFLLNYLDVFNIEQIKSFAYKIYGIMTDYINSNEIGNKIFQFDFYQ